MKRIFADANVFLRFFQRDDEDQRHRASRLLHEAAAGVHQLVTGPPVLFEVAWTLRSSYRLTREECLAVLYRILALPGLEVTDRSRVEAALQLAVAGGGEFADAYIAASIEPTNCQCVATFNRKHFEKMGAPLCEF
ncbi:MAG TPA: type II toxin-antitoxin system VapC family toxin [Planctomycetota bacterium]|nr:type II toxin-antitoxin system VapC family toxin [Planctomycetota bacterium]